MNKVLRSMGKSALVIAGVVSLVAFVTGIVIASIYYFGPPGLITLLAIIVFLILTGLFYISDKGE